MDMLNLIFINTLKLVKRLVITMWDFGLISGKRHHEFFPPLEVLHQRDSKLLWNGKFHIVAIALNLHIHMIVATNENETANVPYVMTLTRLDIAYVVSCTIKMIYYNELEMKKIFPYLQGTFDYDLFYSSDVMENVLTSYCDLIL